MSFDGNKELEFSGNWKVVESKPESKPSGNTRNLLVVVCSQSGTQQVVWLTCGCLL